MPRSRTLALALGFVGAALLLGQAAPAAPTATGCGVKFTWTTNGHQYKGVCKKNATWPQAVAGARRAGGHLVTLSSAAENRFVFAHINFAAIWRPNGQGVSAGPWIGLIQKAGSAEPSGGFGWITGEPLTYTDWSPGEPNNSSTTFNNKTYTDDAGVYWDNGSGHSARWDDVPHQPGAGLTNGYVIEWDHPKK